MDVSFTYLLTSSRQHQDQEVGHTYHQFLSSAHCIITSCPIGTVSKKTPNHVAYDCQSL